MGIRYFMFLFFNNYYHYSIVLFSLSFGSWIWISVALGMLVSDLEAEFFHFSRILKKLHSNTERAVWLVNCGLQPPWEPSRLQFQQGEIDDQETRSWVLQGQTAISRMRERFRVFPFSSPICIVKYLNFLLFYYEFVNGILKLWIFGEKSHKSTCCKFVNGGDSFIIFPFPSTSFSNSSPSLCIFAFHGIRRQPPKYWCSKSITILLLLMCI